MTASDILSPLLQYGVLGIFAIILLVFAYDAWKREQKRADSATAEVARLNMMIAEKMIPALTMATQSIAAAQTVLQAMQYQRDVEAASKGMK